jgi:hypothetical protein
MVPQQHNRPMKQETAMICPKCSSDNTQTLQVVYESGTQDFNARSHTGGLFGLRGIGIGGAITSTTGSSSSKFAQRAAPPAKKRRRWAILGILVGLLFLGNSYPLALTLLGGCGYWLWAILKFNKSEWPELHAAWSASWICHKCGNVYTQG